MNQPKKGRAVRSMGRGQSRKRKGNYRRRRGKSSDSGLPQFQGIEKVYYTYLNLIDEHNVARKRHFEMYFRGTDKQFYKIESDYYQTLQKLRNFEKNTSDEEWTYIREKLGAQKLDTEYSRNHELPIEGEEINFDGKFDDPHLLQSQAQSDFSSDIEESVGSFDDYKKLKGISE